MQTLATKHQARADVSVARKRLDDARSIPETEGYYARSGRSPSNDFRDRDRKDTIRKAEGVLNGARVRLALTRRRYYKVLAGPHRHSTVEVLGVETVTSVDASGDVSAAPSRNVFVRPFLRGAENHPFSISVSDLAPCDAYGDPDDSVEW